MDANMRDSLAAMRRLLTDSRAQITRALDVIDAALGVYKPQTIEPKPARTCSLSPSHRAKISDGQRQRHAQQRQQRDWPAKIAEATPEPQPEANPATVTKPVDADEFGKILDDRVGKLVIPSSDSPKRMARETREALKRYEERNSKQATETAPEPSSYVARSRFSKQAEPINERRITASEPVLIDSPKTYRQRDVEPEDDNAQDDGGEPTKE